MSSVAETPMSVSYRVHKYTGVPVSLVIRTSVIYPSGLVQRFFNLSLSPAPLKGGISKDQRAGEPLRQREPKFPEGHDEGLPMRKPSLDCEANKKCTLTALNLLILNLYFHGSQKYLA